ncbi:MAG: hypothetical protein R6T98_06795 [Desulfatiglandales bacterium]
MFDYSTINKIVKRVEDKEKKKNIHSGFTTTICEAIIRRMEFPDRFLPRAAFKSYNNKKSKVTLR